MISDKKNKAKTVPIIDLLRVQGMKPCKVVGQEFVYYSPFRSEKHPSFFVNVAKNCFHDFGGISDEKGDVIRFTQLLFKLSFQQAIDKLLNFDSIDYKDSFSFSGLLDQSNQSSKIEILLVQDLAHPTLIAYVQSRGISSKVANMYLKEVHYQAKGKRFFAVGFQNDKGGYELRNGLNFKGGKTLNAITTIDKGTEDVLLFEGFFDYLSVIECTNRLYMAKTAIILNSCNNINHLSDHLIKGKTLHCYLDNDEAGERVVNWLINRGCSVKDWSKSIYPNHKDFNEYWSSKCKK